jgi:gluconolactonase
MKMDSLHSLALAVVVVVLTGNISYAQRRGAETSAPKPAKSQTAPAAKKDYPTIGTIERLDPAIDRLVPPDAVIEVLASGFRWSEGPVWIRSGRHLLFSDVPQNIVFKWQEGAGTSEFLNPSGYTGKSPRGREPGSNGLTLDAQGRLILCQHGDRQVVRLEKDGSFTILARYINYRRFNSPNDLVYKSNGDLYFTDPPYGLPKLNEDPAKELLINGVYRLRKDGQVDLLISDLSFPNGIAFSPDEKILYVAVSDPKFAVIMAYNVMPDGTVGRGRILLNTTPMVPNRKGLPDGLKVDQAGNLFATGPGGVLVISPEGRHLGTINTGEPTANCAWGEDGSVLYITANDKLVRIRTSTKGKMP